VDLQTLVDNIKTQLTNVGVGIAAIGLLWLGLRIMLKWRAQEGLREGFQGVGLVAVGCVLVGGAAGLAGLLINLGTTIGGK